MAAVALAESAPGATGGPRLDDATYIDALRADEEGELAGVLDSLGERVDLEDGEAADQLLGFGERAIDDPDLPVGDLDTRTGRAGKHPFTAEQDAGHRCLTHVLLDGGLRLR
jgi:hypothetical protein